jgi:hypothetical protein
MSGFDVVPDEVLVVLFALSFVVVPVAMFVHELGHAVVAVILSGQRVTVRIGSRDALVRFALGRIDIRWHPTGYVAECEWSTIGTVPPRDLVRMALAGPAAETGLALALGILALALADSGGVLFWIAAIGGGLVLLEALLNLIPLRNPPAWLGEHGDASDGWLAREWARTYRGTPAWLVPVGEGPGYREREKQTREVLDAVRQAERAARNLGSSYLGTEHLLLALASGEGPAGEVLRAAGVESGRLRDLLKTTERASNSSPRPRLTPSVRRALKRARGLPSLGGRLEVGPEYMLLALLQDDSSQAWAAVERLGAEPVELRRRLLQAL